MANEEDAAIEPVARLAQKSSRRLLFLLAIALTALLVIRATPLGAALASREALAALLRVGGENAAAYFLATATLLIAVGTPRLLLCAIAGAAFGFWEGLLWSLAASLIGSYATFRAARWGGRQWLIERLGSKRFFARFFVHLVDAEPTIASVALVRLLPLNNGIINLGLALSSVGGRAFWLGSLLGFLPHGAVAVLVGAGLVEDVSWKTAAQFGIAAALVAAGSVWLSRQRRGNR